MTHKTDPARIFCFGEMLWDELPSGRRPGGAPMNVAYHLSRFGLQAVPVSAIGKDADGDALLAKLVEWKIPTGWITRRDDLPTGTVQAKIDSDGNAKYTIVENVAWDHIEVSDELLLAVSDADALIFGSLAQRSVRNCKMLAKLTTALPKRSLRVFDVNLRAPFDDLATVGELASTANVLKVNHEEAAELGGNPIEECEANARSLTNTFGISTVCITAGSMGAGLLSDGVWTFESGRKVQVRDTVGAGDSFLAALVEGLLAKRALPEILRRACRLGEFVATQSGATPDYDPDRLF